MASANGSPSHLKLLGSVYHLKLPIPRAIRHMFPSKTGKPREHIEESLRTKDRREAERLKHGRIAFHMAEFKRRAAAATAKARQDPASAEARSAREFRESLRQAATDHEREILYGLATDRADEMMIKAGANPGEEGDPPNTDSEAYRGAKRFVDLVMTKETLREAWATHMAGCEHNAATKVKDEQAFRGLMDYLKTHAIVDPTVDDAPPSVVAPAVARDYVRWLNTEAQSARGGPLSYPTKLARVSPLRAFWSDYLEHNEVVPVGSNPWRGQKVTGKRKSTDDQTDKKRVYTDAEILALLKGPEVADRRAPKGKAANSRGGTRYPKRTLMELYALGFYTGARISEIANRLLGDIEKIRGGYILHIRKGKKDDSIRSIPILHTIPVRVLKRRIGERKEPTEQLFAEFIPGGPEGSLAWYPGKALGRYRDKVGLGVAVDTHSTRRQLITTLVKRGHPLTLVQWYVGHKPPGITAGVYAQPDAEGLRTIAKAIHYPANLERAFVAALGL